MIECAVQHQIPHQGAYRQSPVLPHIQVQRQVQRHRPQVQQAQFPHRSFQTAPLQFLPEKIAADHKKEGDRDPCNHTGQNQIPHWEDFFQRLGVDFHHQYRTKHPKPVQFRPTDTAALCHAATSRIVTIQPSTLLPETVTPGPSGKENAPCS